MICLEEKVRWWKIVNETTHVFLGEDLCKENQPGLYAEYPDGSREYYSEHIEKLTQWHWENLNEDEKSIARELYNNKDEFGMMKFHNEMLLSGSTICCDSELVRRNFKAAINQGII